MKRLKIIKSYISTGNYDQFITNLLHLSDTLPSSYVCVSNVHMSIEAYDDPAFLAVVNNADMATPDGMPLVKAMNWLYDANQERVAGMDLMPSLMQTCEEQGKSIYLYGATEEVIEKILARAKIDFPALRIDGYSPPFRVLSVPEKEEIVETINSGSYDFVFVALGCPKQEKWMAEHKGLVRSCMVGLGGAFEVYAQVKDRAPQWMQDYSMEWVYRLLQDPKRLWKRYMYTNNKFLYLLMKQYLSIKLLNKDVI